MKGKLYKFDNQSGKMVEVDRGSELEIQMISPIANFPPDSQLVGLGIVSSTPPLENGEFTAEHKENLREVFRMADREAEKNDRRDCVRIQSRIDQFRQRFDIPE